MNTMILPAEVLNLPESFANMFKGKRVELCVQDDSVIIKPVDGMETIEKACGMFKSDGHAVERFLERKREEKVLN